MIPIVSEFVRFCDKNNIKLLSEDIAYISRWMTLADRIESRAILRDYLLEWRKGMSDELNPSKKMNSGRLRANTWLRGRCLGGK
jgi:hypothetical protein